MIPNPTLSFYAANAAAYAARNRFEPGRSRSAKDYARRMETFLGLLPTGGDILELGCGAGHDTAAMREYGFTVRPTDGSPEMAAEAAARLGHPVDVMLFTDLTNDPKDVAAYDGVWASASLLHCPRGEFTDVLARIHRALRANGVLYASFKAGTGEKADKLGRVYNYPDEAWLRAAFARLCGGTPQWANLAIDTVAGGLDYTDDPTTWLHVLARKG